MADSVTAKGSFLVVDPKTGENHVIEKGEVRSPRHKMVKLAPWAYAVPEADEDESVPIRTPKGDK
jgi:hypothetical protein